ncbi:MAG: helix-hairpin-helix domain-containing protein [Minisyncoccota bacterium]
MRHHSYALGLFIFLLPVFVQAAGLININTADAALLDTLPGIGASYAADIIAYRAAHGPFASIEDLQKVPNIGTGSRYTKIAPLITIGDTGASGAPDTGADIAASSTDPTAPPETTVPAYLPPPSELSVQVRGSESAIREVPAAFSAVVKTKSGAIDSAARVLWSFGDGSSGEGSAVEKTYHYAGTYPVVATASDGAATAQGEITVVVKPSAARITLVSDEGITLANDSDERFDLSLWRLSSSRGTFRIPVGTMLLPHASALFPFSVTNLPIASDAVLTYPSGVPAAQYAPQIGAAAPSSEQPAVATTSYTPVQEVEPIIRTRANSQPYEEAVNAPAAATELAAAGAAPVASSSPATPPSAQTPASKVLHSPWTLGLFGVVLAAAGAFILL